MKFFKRFFLLSFLFVMVFNLIGCTEGNKDLLSNKYTIGQEISFGEEKFNIYKIDDKKEELYLLAQHEIATTVFSSSSHKGADYNRYAGSIVESYVDEYVNSLETQGVEIKSSGIIDIDDLYDLGFERSGYYLNGLPYLNTHEYDFVDYVDNYWVGGYCKYDTYIWVYFDEKLDNKQYDNEFGVRPVIIIDANTL